MSRPPLQGMLEFGLYVKDVSRAADFYHDLFGFPVLLSNERIAALDVEGKQILLLFKHGGIERAHEYAWGCATGARWGRNDSLRLPHSGE